MKRLTNNEINNILDSVKPHAKIVCDRIYNEVINSGIEEKKAFKTLIDMCFNDVAEITIGALKDDFNAYFELSKYSTIDITEIYLFMNTQKLFKTKSMESETDENLLSNAILTIIDKSVYGAFVEKLAEYLNVDISDITNK